MKTIRCLSVGYIDYKDKCVSHSKYKYKATNIKNNETIVGLANDICSKIGISNKLINKYGKNSYVFNSCWKIDLLEVI